MSGTQLTIKLTSEENLHFTKEHRKKRIQGEVLHLALSFLRNLKEVEKIEAYVMRAMVIMGEKIQKWNMESDFIQPLKSLLSHPEAQTLFSEDAEEILCERSIIYPHKDPLSGILVLRPDRIVLFKNKVLVADFKSDRPPENSDIMNKYKNQIQKYLEAVKATFNRPAEGYLLFIHQKTIEKVL